MSAQFTPGPWGFRARLGPREVTLKREHWEVGVHEELPADLGIREFPR